MALQLLGVGVEVVALVTLPRSRLNRIVELQLLHSHYPVLINTAQFELRVPVVLEMTNDVVLHALCNLFINY